MDHDLTFREILQLIRHAYLEGVKDGQGTNHYAELAEL